jgi:16S rRNA (guanine527-N7)-methyltransferase
MVRRHFGESLFLARHLPQVGSLLDLGSGAGFPGLPIQLARPALKVTLAESQHKKSSFLREVVRSLGLKTEVWVGRAEDLPATRQFDVVAMRAVDTPEAALAIAMARIVPGGFLAEMTTRQPNAPVLGEGGIEIPMSDRGILRIWTPSLG